MGNQEFQINARRKIMGAKQYASTSVEVKDILVEEYAQAHSEWSKAKRKGDGKRMQFWEGALGAIVQVGTRLGWDVVTIWRNRA